MRYVGKLTFKFMLTKMFYLLFYRIPILKFSTRSLSANRCPINYLSSYVWNVYCLTFHFRYCSCLWFFLYFICLLIVMLNITQYSVRHAVLIWCTCYWTCSVHIKNEHSHSIRFRFRERERNGKGGSGLGWKGARRQRGRQ